MILVCCCGMKNDYRYRVLANLELWLRTPPSTAGRIMDGKPRWTTWWRWLRGSACQATTTTLVAKRWSQEWACECRWASFSGQWTLLCCLVRLLGWSGATAAEDHQQVRHPGGLRVHLLRLLLGLAAFTLPPSPLPSLRSQSRHCRISQKQVIEKS